MKIESESVTFIVAAIGVATAVWTASFDLGAFGVIFFQRMAGIWVISLAILLAAVVLPRNNSPLQWWGYFLMMLPSLWMVLRIFDDVTVVGQTLDTIIHVTSMAVWVISLPYIGYVFLSLTNPDIINLERKFILSLIGIAVLIGSLGYYLGRHNYLILSCENFIISGSDTPANCAKEK